MAAEFDWTLGDNDAEVYALTYVDSDGAEQIEDLTGKTVTLELYPEGVTTAVTTTSWVAVLSAAAGTVTVTRPSSGHGLTAQRYSGRFKVAGGGTTRSFPKGQPARWTVRT
jgi:hypothetical protein